MSENRRSRATTTRRDPRDGERGSAKAWLLAFVVAVAGGFGLLIGVGCAVKANACPFGEKQSVPRTTGAQIYAADCMLCHGARGEGTPGRPPLASGEAASLTLEQIVNKIERGSPGIMPRFKGKLTPHQIDLVARYVVELRGTP